MKKNQTLDVLLKDIDDTIEKNYYNIRSLLKLKEELLKGKHQERKIETRKVLTTEMEPKQDLDSILSEELKRINIGPTLDGYTYIIAAIKMIVKEQGKIISITKYIYPTIAKNYNHTDSQVERSMRHAIKKSYSFMNNEEKLSYFGTLVCKPTNAEFLYAFFECLKLKRNIMSKNSQITKQLVI